MRVICYLCQVPAAADNDLPFNWLKLVSSTERWEFGNPCLEPKYEMIISRYRSQTHIIGSIQKAIGNVWTLYKGPEGVLLVVIGQPT